MARSNSPQVRDFVCRQMTKMVIREAMLLTALSTTHVQVSLVEVSNACSLCSSGSILFRVLTER
ncbi:hypothetical protein J6590_103092 [Homalodisca vitripennis]|nr:hypothetical protein J6590_103092 [Homalodisca vitripennis]